MEGCHEEVQLVVLASKPKTIEEALTTAIASNLDGTSSGMFAFRGHQQQRNPNHTGCPSANYELINGKWVPMECPRHQHIQRGNHWQPQQRNGNWQPRQNNGQPRNNNWQNRNNNFKPTRPTQQFQQQQELQQQQHL